MMSEQRFPGWSVVWAAFIIAMFGWGIGFYGPGVFLQTLHATRDWPIAVISAAVTAHFLIGAGIVAYLPEVYRGLGLANATIAAAVLSALGIIAWSNATAPWQLFGAAILSGSGWAGTSGAAVNAMVAPWFDKDRPKALSHAFNGASIGGVIFTPMLVWLTASIGFQQSALMIGLAMALAVGLLARRYLRRVPSDLGVAPDGEPPGATRPIEKTPPSPRSQLIRTRRFVTVSAAFALALFAQVGLLSHLLARLAPVFGPESAAMVVSLTTISAVAGRFLLGWLIQNHDRRYAACLNFGVQSVGVVLLCLGDNEAILLTGCILFGLGVGNVAALPALIAQKEFRPIDVGTVVALVIAINQAVFALAPAILGGLRELTSDYLLSFAVAGAVQTLAALIVVLGSQGSGRRMVANR